MEKHDLLHEFPEYQDKIHELKISDPYFRKLFDEYHELEHQIHRIHMNIEVAADDTMKELKTKLLYLKDQMYSLIQN